jgi:D-alanyl-D-alanine carboxypeptidase
VRRPLTGGAPARGAGAGLLLAAVLLAGPVGPAAAEAARPTIDPSAPTPSAPYEGLPPQGSAPGGGTVGGPGLDTRGIVVAEGAPPPPKGIAATGWLVADADTGAVLAARDPHGRYYPASTLKALTVLTLVPLVDPEEIVVGTTADEAVEGSRLGMVEGGRYRVRLLLEGLILQSGNDAANALARVAGGTDVALEAMNETAAGLGAFDTVAGTPSGLDVAGQSSSPYDLALIFRALIDDPVTSELLRVRTAQVPPVPGKGPGFQIQNENPLLDTPGNLGGKTGFTDAARHTFVTAAQRGGRRLVVSVMNTEPRPLRASEQAARLLNWGFALPDDVEPVGELVEPGEVPLTPPPVVRGPMTDGAVAVPSAAPATAAAADAASGAGGSPVLPVALGGAALLVVVATGIGVRRAMRAGRRP